MPTATEYLGKPTSRVDGPAKVTGQAKYAAEYNVPGLAYGVIVSSAKARGHRQDHQHRRGGAVPGVLKVFSFRERPEDRLSRPQPPRPDRTQQRVALSGRCTRRNSNTAASRLRWWSRRISRRRVTPPRSSTPSTRKSPTRPTCEANLWRRRTHRLTTRTGYVSAAQEATRQSAGGVRPRALQDPGGIFSQPVEHHNPMENYASTVRLRRGRQADDLPEDPGRAKTARNTCAACSACRRATWK